MKKLIKLTLFAVLLLNTPPLKAAYALEDAIIAIVNDEIITYKDLLEYIKKTYISLAAEGMDDRQLQEIMKDLERNGLEKLIEDKLIISQAKTIGLAVREKLVDERLAEIKERYPSEQSFMDNLIKNGANLTDLRNRITENLQITFVIDHEVKSKIFVNPQEVTKFYEENIEKFRKKDRVNLESIFIAYKNNKPAAVDKAQAALKDINSGTDFKEVAKRYSDAPSIGVVERGQLMPKIEDVIFNLDEGQVSGILEVDTGIYIFLLTGKTPAELAELKEVKDLIYNTIYKQKFREKYDEWLQKLKKDAFIEIKK